jgi:hypothetical protein
MEVTGKGLSDDDLIFDVTNGPTAVDFGNLGTIRVKTRSAGWDIWMTTDNGGRLVNEATRQCVDVPDIDDWGDTLKTTTEECTGDFEYLTFKSGHATDSSVVLGVAIGLAKTGKALGRSGAEETLYPIPSAISGGVQFISPVVIDSVDMRATEKSLGASLVPVSFADSLGGATKTTWGIFQNGNVMNATTSTSNAWTKIKTDGFPRPTDNFVPEEEYFYVNAGIKPDVFAKLAGNTKGTYKETFNFELIANF